MGKVQNFPSCKRVGQQGCCELHTCVVQFPKINSCRSYGGGGVLVQSFFPVAEPSEATKRGGGIQVA